MPVLRGTQLVGVVTRSDLVRALAGRIPAVDASQAPSDEAIRVRLRAELERQPWWQAKWSTVLVTDGMVRYLGVSDGQADRQAARVAAESIAGVRGVRDDRLEFADWQPMVV